MMERGMRLYRWLRIAPAVIILCSCATATTAFQSPTAPTPSINGNPHPVAHHDVRWRTRIPTNIGAALDSVNSISSSSTTPSSSPPSSSSHFYSRKSLPDFYSAASQAAATATSAAAATTADPDAAALIFAQLCQGAGIERPSKIQTLAWPALLSSTSSPQQQQHQQQQQQAVVIADQTGSGKTLAYLIPLLHRILVSKKIKPNRRDHSDKASSQDAQSTAPPVTSTTSSTSTTTPAQPKLLILAPTAELADQICSVCQQIALNYNHKSSHSAAAPPFRAAVLTSTGHQATNIRDQIRLLQQQAKRLDVLVSTPGRIATILRTRKAAETVLDLSQLQAIVLDEVDVLLLDETFAPQLKTVGEATQPKQQHPTTQNHVTQFVFVTATLPDSVVAQITDQFHNHRVQLLKGPGLHRVAPTVSETLVDVSVPAAQNRDPRAGFDVKVRALELALRQHRVRRTLVFCNAVQACRSVENFVRRLDRSERIYQVRAYHNALTASVRNENLDWFAARGNNDNNNDNDDNVARILVCTDRAARGVDFGASAVDHCVLFDFPSDPADYVRRVGRTARAGRTGAVTVLAYGWQLPVARSVMNQQQHHQQKTNKRPRGGGGSSSFGTDASLYNDRTTREQDDIWGDDRDSSSSSSTEYMGGVQGRRRQTSSQGTNKKEKNADKNSIESNIASGSIWGH